MKRFALFILMLGASLLLLNILTGCGGIPKNGAAGNQSLSVNSSSGSGAGSYKSLELKHFTQTEGLGLSQEFVDSFYEGLREHLIKAGVANQIIDEGAVAPDADIASTIVVEGKFTEFQSGALAGIVGSEIKLYRKNDHSLITTITPRVPYKPSPFNTDRTIGKASGGRTAYEIKKALR
ncbi:MAG TPA: hypothetical protein VMU29_14265 [Smithella sp.]|nr:hypothetical protein [Smithella sp.]